MDDKKTVISYGRYIYNFTKIPLYIYNNNHKILDCFPMQSDYFYPPLHYIQVMCSMQKPVTYYQTTCHTYFGMIHVEGQDCFLVLGPVNPVDFSKDVISQMCKDYVISQEHYTVFYDYFQHIPRTTVTSFIQLLLLINFSINHSEITIQDFPEFQSSHLLQDNMNEMQAASFFDLKENDNFYNNQLIERELIECIETGDLKKLNVFSDRAHRLSRFGTVAKDNLRQIKNTFIIAVTIISRAAVNGGLPGGVAYSLADIYMQQMEQLNDVSSVLSLMHTVQQDFCRRVSDTKNQEPCDDLILKAIEYIHQNTNKPIKTDDVAYAIGFSRTYLSRRFKQETGFNISDFIRRCKLEEGRSLLLYTDKPISQISSYLCFSSQSHFHNLFKKQFGITPLACRRQGNRKKV